MGTVTVPLPDPVCRRHVDGSDPLHGGCPVCHHALDLHPNFYTGNTGITACIVCELVVLRDSLVALLPTPAPTSPPTPGPGVYRPSQGVPCDGTTACRAALHARGCFAAAVQGTAAVSLPGPLSRAPRQGPPCTGMSDCPALDAEHAPGCYGPHTRPGAPT